ncbi:MAG: polyphenol oxidase family protein [bacterium]|nr:polyphenol oxidase family protein [bacterium]
MYRLDRFAELTRPHGFFHGCSTAEEGNLGFGHEPKVDVIAQRGRFTRAVHPDFHLVLGVGMVPMQPGREEVIALVGSSQQGCGMVEPFSGPFAEALIARESFLFVASGDCPTIFLCDPVTRHFAIVHASRESSVREITRRTIEYMDLVGVNPFDLIAGIGPGIRQESYVLQTFAPAAAADSPWGPFCRVTDEGVAVDLIGFNRHLLIAAGVLPERIDVADVDTFSDSRFASYRRAKATGEPDWRHGSVLGFAAE